MNTEALLEKLIAIERALLSGRYLEAHAFVLEAQDEALRVEREMIRLQAEKLRCTIDASAGRSRPPSTATLSS